MPDALVSDPPEASPAASPRLDPERRRCDNCAAPLAGDFCAACGQKAARLRQPIHHLLRDSFSEFFGLDGRVWRTLGALIVKPGTLTVAHFEGRRQRFLSPLRVYLSSTLLFFVLLSLIDPVGRLQATIDNEVRKPENRVHVADHLAANDSLVVRGPAAFLVDPSDVVEAFAESSDSARLGRDSTRVLRIEAFVRDSLAAALATADSSDLARARTKWMRARAESALLRTMPPDSLIYPADVHSAVTVLYPGRLVDASGPTWFVESEGMKRISEASTEAEKRASLVGFLRGGIGYIPTMMFVLLPLFALLMKALYARRGWYYSEHFVFGLHTHAFAFLVFSAIACVEWIDNSGPVVGALLLGLVASLPVYFFLAQKRVYGQGWGKTLLKAVLLGGVYVVALVLGLVAAFVAAAFVA